MSLSSVFPSRPRPQLRGGSTVILLALAWLGSPHVAGAEVPEGPPTAECCRHEDLASDYGIIWTGRNTQMTFEQLAAYAAPILWFSPDEPLLKEGPIRKKGKDIKLPIAFPFEEESDYPVVYFRVRRILHRVDEPRPGTYVADATDPARSTIDLRKVAGVDLDYFFYYPMDVGGNPHKHDVEFIETRLAVGRTPDCEECPFAMGLMWVNAKAHGIQWFDNTLEVDATARLPLHILVEEGKHASCTDRNADGQFTPGYDVTERVNDAWGVRDTLGTGTFFTGDYKSWMTKVRQEDTKVFPPLPEDSPHRLEWSIDGEYAPDHAIYTLRPWPSAERADADLVHYIADKGDPDWPEIRTIEDATKFYRWLTDESWAESWALAARGANDNFGFSLAFPFLIFKNLQDPLGGGWFVHRVYFQGRDLEDFGWLINYSPSASRWVDGYFAVGLEWDYQVENGVASTKRYTVTETGMKFRFDFTRTPLRFMRKLGTNFWGFRVGIQVRGIWSFENLGYVFEFGAGSW
jgi:hypothetical protein